MANRWFPNGERLFTSLPISLHSFSISPNKPLKHCEIEKEQKFEEERRALGIKITQTLGRRRNPKRRTDFVAQRMLSLKIKNRLSAPAGPKLPLIASLARQNIKKRKRTKRLL